MAKFIVEVHGDDEERQLIRQYSCVPLKEYSGYTKLQEFVDIARKLEVNLEAQINLALNELSEVANGGKR